MRCERLIILSVLLVLPVISSAAQIRFFNLNRHGQLTQRLFVRHADEPGCHNFFRKQKLIRVAQVGFEYCQVYADRDCPATEALNARWGTKHKKAPVNKLTDGSRWLLGDGRTSSFVPGVA